MKEILEFNIESHNDDWTLVSRRVRGCNDTLEKVWDVLLRFKRERNLPELT